MYPKASLYMTAKRMFVAGGKRIPESSLQLVTLFTATQSNRFTHD
jgi:hypothetical protein